MGLGYLLLAVKSEQDNYLVGNPQFTYFKSVYRRHTNFAIDNIYQDFVGDTRDCWSKKMYINIPKTGDLVHRMYLVVDLSVDSGVLDKAAPLAYSLLEYVELYVGGQSIDKHYGEWLYIWHELMSDKRKELALANMISIHSSNNSNIVYIPLRFWFNNDVGLALPLISLQYNDVRLEFKFNSREYVEKYSYSEDATVSVTGLHINQLQLLTEFIHLDQEERRLFSSNKHEYLITQVQSSMSNAINLYPTESNSSYEDIKHRMDLRFNHPVKELFWTFQDSSGYINNNDVVPTQYEFYPYGILQYNYWRNYTNLRDHMIGCNLVLNGKDMSEELPPQFYRSVQQYQYHNGYGVNYINNLSASNVDGPNSLVDLAKGSGIYSYSFAFNPEVHQPSGSLNFSKLEKAQLKFRLYRDQDNNTLGGSKNIRGKIVNIYAVNYNVLRIMGGMAGLAFTN